MLLFENSYGLLLDLFVVLAGVDAFIECGYFLVDLCGGLHIRLGLLWLLGLLLILKERIEELLGSMLHIRRAASLLLVDGTTL